jgi:hypothetical protein
MHRFRSNARLFAWIASFAILASAFAPAIARMLADASDGAITLAQICGVDGQGAMRAAAASLGSQQPGHDDTLPDVVECAYCLSHASVPAPPPAFASFAPPPRLSAGPPPRFLDSRAPLFAWIAAAPRGPPRIA